MYGEVQWRTKSPLTKFRICLTYKKGVVLSGSKRHSKHARHKFLTTTVQVIGY